MTSSGVEPVPVDIASAQDRPPRRWYVRMVRHYIGTGPYLDFGCGTGQLLRRLGEHGSASGFEIFEHAARLSRNTAPGCPVHTALDSIPTGVYRGITAVHVLQYLDDETAATALACWRRVLVPGGKALVVVPDPAGRARQLTGDSGSGRHERTHAWWHQFFRDEGFTVVREGSDGMWNVPYGRLPAFLDAVLHALPSMIQFAVGRLLVRPGAGESSVFVLQGPLEE